MDLSRLRTRRGVVAALVAAAASRVLPAPVRAQLNSGCEYGITNGLVTIGGTDCHVAVPGHMIDARSTTDSASANTGTTSTTSTQSPKEIRQDRLERRRDHHKTKSSRRNRQHQERNQREQDRKILCEDFSSQLAAVEAMAQNPWAAGKLDPDGDGVPCEHLRELTCSEFRNEDEATNWFNRMGYSKTYDPFKLFDAEADSVCATFRVTCDDFRTQKEAIEWITEHPRDKKRLDQGSKKMPCPDLPTVTCKSFSNATEAANWFEQNGFAPNDDPYGLWNTETNAVCVAKVTCADFKNQKAAVEWLADHPEDTNRLGGQDGAACETLDAVRCSQLGTEAEATAWFQRVGFNCATRDPYGLCDGADICPANG